MAHLTKKQKTQQGKIDSNKLYPLSDALVLVTEWSQFKNLDFFELGNKVKNKIMFDGRRFYLPRQMEGAGWEYFTIGTK